MRDHMDAPYRVHAEQGASARRLPLWIIEDPKATCKQSKELCEESEKLCDKAKIVRAESGEVVEQARQAMIASRLRRKKRMVITKEPAW
jgi:hypothetical protein